MMKYLNLIEFFQIFISVLIFCALFCSVIEASDNVNVGFKEKIYQSFKNYTNYISNIFKKDEIKKSANESKIVFETEEYFNPDQFLNVPELLRKYNYPVEEHTVQTGDGYILGLHRIPRYGGIPVYLQHGLLDSSAGWILLGPEKSLAYMLYNQGYDVWMGNTRGNTYSRKHIYLNIDTKKFWDITLTDIGMYDLPATIDYILKETNFEKIHYIGHSQGTTSFFIMCAIKPKYCDKILLMSALSPVVYLEHVKSPLINTLAFWLNPLDMLFKILGIYEMLPNTDLLKIAGQVACNEESIIQPLCTNIFFLLCGYDSDQLNKTLVPVFLSHVPAGASTKQIVHYGQLRKSNKFRMYDYGFIQNYFVYYGTFKPPHYDLSKTTAPVAIYYSTNDWLADTRDVYKLEKELPNIEHRYIVPMAKFNHLDFIFANDVKKLLYNEVVRVMKKAEDKYMLSSFDVLTNLLRNSPRNNNFKSKIITTVLNND